MGRKTCCSFAMILSVLQTGLAFAGDEIMAPETPDSAKSPLFSQSPDGAFRLYGQINLGFLSYDDGAGTVAYGLVSNSNSVSRLGAEFRRRLDSEWSLGGVFEFQVTPYPSDSVNLANRGDRDFSLTRDDLRYLDLILAGKSWGTFYGGQGNMASEGSTKADLSGTTVAAFSDVADTAGGQFLRTSAGALSSFEIGDVFKEYDGLGRQLRLRYDTPALSGGFGGSASWGVDALADDDTPTWDIAATYAGQNRDFQAAAKLAYAWKGEGTEILSGSVSLLHLSTGVSLTVASAQQNDNGQLSDYGYLKLGYQNDLIRWGKTAFSLDYYDGTDIGGPGSNSRSAAVTVVQNLSHADTQVYATIRQYRYDDPAETYQDGQAILFGANWKF